MALHRSHTRAPSAALVPISSNRRVTPTGKVERTVKIILGAIVVLESVEEIRFLVKRARRVSTSWWSDVEHRESRRLRVAEAGYLFEHLERIQGMSRRRGGAGGR